MLRDGFDIQAHQTSLRLYDVAAKEHYATVHAAQPAAELAAAEPARQPA